MANYLKGIGDAATRVNEILPSFDARINNFLCGHTSGIIKNEFYEFSARAIDRGVVINSGMMQAHGFFGASDTDTQINFVMPGTTQYVHIYAEIDLSVVPNKFDIKATGMSNSTAYTFRQDNLRSTANGKFQLHLWQVTLTASTIILTDRRAYIDKPSAAVTAEDYTASGGIATQLNLKAPLASPALTGTPTAPTAAQTVNNTQLATTGYVRQAISDVRNITTGAITVTNSTLRGENYVKRQVNFVYGRYEFNAIGTGTSAKTVVIGNVPSNYRPKSDIVIYPESYIFVFILMGSGSAAGSISGTIKTNGDIELSFPAIASGAGTSYSTNAIAFGYEIT